MLEIVAADVCFIAIKQFDDFGNRRLRSRASVGTVVAYMGLSEFE